MAFLKSLMCISVFFCLAWRLAGAASVCEPTTPVATTAAPLDCSGKPNTHPKWSNPCFDLCVSQEFCPLYLVEMCACNDGYCRDKDGNCVCKT